MVRQPFTVQVGTDGSRPGYERNASRDPRAFFEEREACFGKMMRSTRLFKRRGRSPTWHTVGEVSPEKVLFVTPDDQEGCCARLVFWEGLLLRRLAFRKPAGEDLSPFDRRVIRQRP